MAEKINIEIGLDGGEEVERQLENIGKAGQQAFGDIQGAADGVDLSSMADQFSSIQQAVQSAVSLEKFAQRIGQVQEAFDSLGNAAEKMASRLTRSLGVFGVFARALGAPGIALGVLAGAFLKFGDSSADAINKLTTEGAKIGLTAQQLDILQQAFGRLGVAPDAVASGLQKFAETVGGNVYANLQKFIDQLERMPDSVARTQLAMATLGDALGGQVIAGLQTGTISAQNFATAIAGVSPATQAQIIEAAKYEQALNRLNAAWTAVKASFAPIVTPLFDFLTGELKQFVADLKRLQVELAFLKGIWDVFVAGIKGQNVEEASRRAAESITKLKDQLTQSSNAADVLGRNTAAAMGQVQQAAEQAKPPLTGLFDRLPTDASFAGVQAGQALAQGVGQGVEQAKPYLTGLFDRLPTDASVAGEQAGQALGQGIGQGAQQGAAALDPLTQKWQQLEQAAQKVNLPISQLLNSIPEGAQNSADALAMIEERLNAITAAADQARMAWVRFGRGIPTFIDTSGPGHGTPGVGHAGGEMPFAAGGLIGGRGTGTSDSNLAWVSRGEHIMPARAVRQPGMLALLEALRRSGGNLSRVLDGMGRFALGGLVPRTMPAFASGGPVGGMSHVTIAFPGVPPVSGLRASSGVIDELHRAAALAQVRSGGRKPSRYS